MNAEIETAIEKLLRQHGEQKVRKHLSKIMFANGTGWSDWQRLASTVQNTANRIKRNDRSKH